MTLVLSPVEPWIPTKTFRRDKGTSYNLIQEYSNNSRQVDCRYLSCTCRACQPSDILKGKKLTGYGMTIFKGGGGARSQECRRHSIGSTVVNGRKNSKSPAGIPLMSPISFT
jgi:hypothetical protein